MKINHGYIKNEDMKSNSTYLKYSESQYFDILNQQCFRIKPKKIHLHNLNTDSDHNPNIIGSGMHITLSVHRVIYWITERISQETWFNRNIIQSPFLFGVWNVVGSPMSDDLFLNISTIRYQKARIRQIRAFNGFVKGQIRRVYALTYAWYVELRDLLMHGENDISKPTIRNVVLWALPKLEK